MWNQIQLLDKEHERGWLFPKDYLWHFSLMIEGSSHFWIFTSSVFLMIIIYRQVFPTIWQVAVMYSNWLMPTGMIKVIPIALHEVQWKGTWQLQFYSRYIHKQVFLIIQQVTVTHSKELMSVQVLPVNWQVEVTYGEEIMQYRWKETW